MTNLNNPISKAKNTNISADLPEFDFGEAVKALGTFLSGFGAAYGANSLTEANKITKLTSGMSNDSQSRLIALYNQQKGAIALLNESVQSARNNPSRRAQANKEIRESRAFISENYKDMASTIADEIPGMRVNSPKTAALAETVVQGLREEAVKVLDPKYPVKDLRPQDSQVKAKPSNVHIANNQGVLKTSAENTSQVADTTNGNSVTQLTSASNTSSENLNNMQVISSSVANNSGIIKESTENSVEHQKIANPRANVSEVVKLLQNNAAEVKKEYGLDVTTSEGLGRAVMQYWKENNLDPKTLREQLPNLKDSEFETASKTPKNINVTQTTKNDQRSM
jgi:hypothetical protein